MKKKGAQKRKFTETMKKKLAGLFGVILLALIGLIMGITYINAKSGEKYTASILSFLRCGIKSITLSILCSSTPSFSNGAPVIPSGYI